MADVAVSLRTYLVAQSAISDVISSRMYPDRLSQDTALPAVTYRKVSGTHDHTIGGLAGIATARITYDCFATTRAVSAAIADSIRDALDGLRGTQTSVFINDVRYDSGPEYYTEAPQDGSDDERYITSIDFLVTYLE